MKRYFTLALILFTALNLNATKPRINIYEPEHKYELRLGWSGRPTYSIEFGCYNCWDRTPNLDILYGPYKGNQYTTGNITAEFVTILNRKLSFSIGLSFSDCYAKKYDSITGAAAGYNHELMLAAYPQLRAYWFRKEYVSMYSACALGIGFYDSEFLLFPQIYPIGIEVGKGKLYGFGEVLNFGLHSLGGTIGFGYRF